MESPGMLGEFAARRIAREGYVRNILNDIENRRKIPSYQDCLAEIVKHIPPDSLDTVLNAFQQNAGYDLFAEFRSVKPKTKFEEAVQNALIHRRHKNSYTLTRSYLSECMRELTELSPHGSNWVEKLLTHGVIEINPIKDGASLAAVKNAKELSDAFRRVQKSIAQPNDLRDLSFAASRNGVPSFLGTVSSARWFSNTFVTVADLLNVGVLLISQDIAPK